MEKQLDPRRMPAHVAIVMDGNGRWAKGRGLPRAAGHRAGMEALKEIVKRSDVLGIKHLTVYAFSSENWKRSREEVNGIFRLLVVYVEKELAELHANNVRVSILGEWRELPREAVEALERALETTKDNTGLQFHIALNYGARNEIVRAARTLAAQAAEGRIAPEEIDGERFSACLYTAGIPDPDLLIRTSGEERLSNYLLWQCAYSEFVFMDTLWPDFTPERLEEALGEYQRRERRFGGR
ncbi:MAG: isoprenyl transferase [Bacillota bacterium]|nr:isoprenyl transferase [Bacillota bacterium]